MFRPSAGRDTRQRRVVQISRGSLVLVDSPRKNNLQRWLQHSCVRSVGYLVFGNCKRGKQGCVTGGGRDGSTVLFPGVLLALQPVRAWGVVRRRRVPERTMNPSDVMPTEAGKAHLGQDRAAGCTKMQLLTTPDCSCIIHTVTMSSAPAQVTWRGESKHSYTPWAMERGCHLSLSSAALATQVLGL